MTITVIQYVVATWATLHCMHLTCASGKVDFVKFFVEECHCDPRVRNMFGETPLYTWLVREGEQTLSGFSLLTIIVIQLVVH